jgi:hypothetical protein
MAQHLQKLLSISSEPLADAVGPAEIALHIPESGSDLASALALKNGFYAFESALCVFPAAPSDKAYDIAAWNAVSLWKQDYELFPENCLCFAESVFGEQFCLLDGEVFRFDPETGDFESLCRSVEDWAEAILNDFSYLTGYPLARDWQARNGALAPKHRLIARIPFVCGGEFAAENLAAIEAARGMRSHANLARQIRDVPDGGKIQFVIGRPP